MENLDDSTDDSIDDKYTIIKEKEDGFTCKVFKVKMKEEDKKIYGAKVFYEIKNKNIFSKEIDISKIFDNEVKILYQLKSKNNPYIINIHNHGIGEIKIKI